MIAETYTIMKNWQKQIGTLGNNFKIHQDQTDSDHHPRNQQDPQLLTIPFINTETWLQINTQTCPQHKTQMVVCYKDTIMPKTTSYTKDRGQNTKQTSFKTETAQDNLGTLCEYENCVSQIHFLFVNFQIKRSLKKTRA